MSTKDTLRKMTTGVGVGAMLACGSVDAEGAGLETFAGEAVPAAWQSGTGHTLRITAQRYKTGSRSLLWEWENGGALTFRDEEAFARPRAATETERAGMFGLWVYSEKPVRKPLHFELLHGEDVVGKCWFWMDYTGWRLWLVRYVETGWTAGTEIDGARLHAPTNTGRLFIDQVHFSLPGHGRYSYQMPWHGRGGGAAKPEGLVFSADDVSVNRPWLPKRRPVTDRERADMETLAKRLLPPAYPLHDPKAKGIDADTLARLQARLDAWAIREREGIVTGRPVTFAHEWHKFPFAPADAVNLPDYMALASDAAEAFADAADPDRRAQLGRMFVTLTAHLLDQGFAEGMASSYMGMGYGEQHFRTVFFRMREVLAPAGLLADTARLIAWLFANMNPGNYLNETPVSAGPMDELGNNNLFLFPAVLMLPDEEERLQRVALVQRYYNLFLMRPDVIGPDGCAYHHDMFHFAYACYQMPHVIDLVTKLSGTEFQLEAAVYDRLRNYVYAMAFATVDGRMPPNVAARSGFPMGADVSKLARILAEAGTPDGQKEIDPLMAGLYMTIARDPEADPIPAWRARGIAPLPLTGHWALNGAAGALHRREDWLVSIFGMARFWPGVEIFGWTQDNNYARYARNGSILVTRPGTDAVGGFSRDGWNWCHWPGTTSLVRPSHELFATRVTLIENPLPFAAGTRLEKDGIWGMDFGGVDVHFRKSAFSFDNRVTVITSDIERQTETDESAETQAAPVVTTLFQNPTDPDADALWINGERVDAFPVERKLDGEASSWLIDPAGTGYLLHAPHDPVRVRRRRQAWTYMHTRDLLDPDTDPGITYKAFVPDETDWAKLPETEKLFRPSEGDFALAYFDHGTSGTGTPCVYTMVVGAGPDDMRALAETQPTEILQRDGNAHIAIDRPSNTLGAVLFAAHDKLHNAAAPLLGNDQPCLVMIRRRDANRIALSVVVPDIKRVEPALNLRLQGQWRIADAPDSGTAAITHYGTESLLAVTPDYYMPSVVELETTPVSVDTPAATGVSTREQEAP